MDESDEHRAFLRTANPDLDEIQREMTTLADEQGFPILGPDAGATCRSIAAMVDANRVFEFGSGFGYSASWFLRGMGDEGTVVLTEIDEDELALAAEFFDRAGLRNRVVLEQGDALEIVEQYDDPVDVALIDHQKERYPEAFAAIRERLPVGGVVVADNVMRSSVVRAVEGSSESTTDGANPEDSRTRGLLEYLDTVRNDDAFVTTVLPVDNGLAVSTRVSE